MNNSDALENTHIFPWLIFIVLWNLKPWGIQPHPFKQDETTQHHKESNDEGLKDFFEVQINVPNCHD